MADDDKYIAKKYWLKDLKSSVWKGECLEVGGDLVFRVNVVASVVQKFISEDGQYVFVVLDDGSETIRSKAWRRDVHKFRDVEIGDIINIFGGLQEYQGEVYLSPIIVRKVDGNWELLRVLELSDGNLVKKEVVEQKKVVDVKVLIKKLDTGKGAGFDELLKVSGLSNAELVSQVRVLMSDGEVYEPEPKRLKVLE
ncbi:MAG: hypothetical protein GON13_02925 [Nanoarchaeota archaeon]|nr:hypothetical protein [Nanoarchaeota archaeon]